MTNLIHLPQPTSETTALPAGVAFVPCAICLRPVDLAAIAEDDRAQLCDDHRAADYVPARAA
jgi:hypothetical protein